MQKLFLLFSFSIILFTGCSMREDVTVISYEDNDISYQSASLTHTLEEKKKNPTYVKQALKIPKPKNIEIASNEEESTDLFKELKDFYQEWRGVRYKLGGTTKSGIDCSAFTQRVFKDKFSFNLPRTASAQSELGKQISKNELNTGDLIFFKTGRNSRHVGIYLEDGKFIHASTKHGVTISTLDNEYFSKHYWKSQRIID